MSEQYSNESLTEKIIQCIIQVHRAHGPGFVERVYHNSLIIELGKRGLYAESEKEVAFYYDGIEVGVHRLDLLVENRIVIELKTVEKLIGIHYSQVRSYLKAAKKDVGVLVNFSTDKADFRRIELR